MKVVDELKNVIGLDHLHGPGKWLKRPETGPSSPIIVLIKEDLDPIDLLSRRVQRRVLVKWIFFFLPVCIVSIVLDQSVWAFCFVGLFGVYFDDRSHLLFTAHEKNQSCQNPDRSDILKHIYLRNKIGNPTWTEPLYFLERQYMSGPI